MRTPPLMEHRLRSMSRVCMQSLIRTLAPHPAHRMGLVCLLILHSYNRDSVNYRSEQAAVQLNL